jgi:hypothetical protein
LTRVRPCFARETPLHQCCGARATRATRATSANATCSLTSAPPAPPTPPRAMATPCHPRPLPCNRARALVWAAAPKLLDLWGQISHCLLQAALPSGCGRRLVGLAKPGGQQGGGRIRQHVLRCPRAAACSTRATRAACATSSIAPPASAPPEQPRSVQAACPPPAPPAQWPPAPPAPPALPAPPAPPAESCRPHPRRPHRPAPLGRADGAA